MKYIFRYNNTCSDIELLLFIELDQDIAVYLISGRSEICASNVAI